jgi:hypothetical protein
MQGLTPTTEVGAMSKDLAMRETLLSEYGQAQADAATAKPGGGDRERDIRQRIAAQYGGGDFAQGLNEIRGKKTQDLRRDRDEAIRKGDPNAALAAEDAANQVLQQSREAKAADEAANKAGTRKLGLQKQLNALKGVDDGAAAVVEGDSEISSINDKVKAVTELNAKIEQYKKAQASGDDEAIKAAAAGVNTARTAAGSVGADPSRDTLESLDLEKQGIQQAIQLRQQQAAIEQAAANNRRNEIMQELRMRQQLSQLNLNNALGQGGQGGWAEQTSEADIKIKNVQESKERLAGADALAAEREPLTQKMIDGLGTDEDADRVQELNKQLSAKGVGEKDTAQDVKNKVTDLTGQELDLRTQQIEGNRNISRDAEIKSLSMQEKYAPNREASEAAKTRREELEDEAKVESKTAQYSQTMDDNVARDLAEKETELERVGIRAEEAGQARVDSLTAVGGGATGFIGANQDPAKKTADLAAQIKGILDSVTTKLDNQTSEAQRLAQEMREAAK